jgi:hypothetical protein
LSAFIEMIAAKIRHRREQKNPTSGSGSPPLPLPSGPQELPANVVEHRPRF